MTTLLVLIIEILCFGVVFTATIAVERGLEDLFGLRRRLREPTSLGMLSQTPVFKESKSRNPIVIWVQSLNDSKENQKLALDLSRAGFNHLAAPALFVMIRFFLAIGLPLAFLLGQQQLGLDVSQFGLIFWSLVLCGVGLVAPRSFIDRRSETRRAELEREFPDALDLLVVCVEAGLGLEAAFVRVGQEMRASYSRIAEEFARVSEELRAGQSRAAALRAMADRTGVGTVKSFVALVIQTESLGISIGQTLRTYSTEMRETRYIKAEEKAMRIPVLMTLPLVVCILPVIITALLLPVAIDVMRVLLPVLAGNLRAG